MQPNKHAWLLRAYFATEKGGTLQHLHLQGVVEAMVIGTDALRRHLKSALGWDDRRLPAELKGKTHICIRTLRNTGLHTWHGMLGYCSKDAEEVHFQQFMVGVSEEDLALGKEQYALHGNKDKNNTVQLTPYTLIERAAQWAKVKMQRTSGISLHQAVVSMIQSGKFRFGGGFTSSKSGQYTYSRAAAVWKAAMNPADFSLDDAYQVLYEDPPAARYYNTNNWYFAEERLAAIHAPEPFDP